MPFSLSLEDSNQSPRKKGPNYFYHPFSLVAMIPNFEVHHFEFSSNVVDREPTSTGLQISASLCL